MGRRSKPGQTARATRLATALLAAVLAAGCGKSVQTGANGGGGGAGAQASPAATTQAQTTYTTPAATKDIDSFTWDLPYGEPTSLDPIKSYGDSENTVLANLCESLQRQNPDFTLSDGLATYKRVDDLTLTYTVRPGVKFSDGKPLTGADVAYSLNRNRQTKLGSYWQAPFYNNVKSITAKGDVVTVALEHPDALFNRMMATAAGAVGEAAYIRAKGSSYGTAKGGVMCTGPYTLASWQPGAKITLEANPGYWDTQLKPKARTVVFDFVTDESTLTSALTSGQIDGSFEVPPESVAQLRSGSGTLTFGAGTQFFAFRPTQRKGPLADPRIRQALSYALDRDSIVKVIFQGAAVPSVTPVDPGAWGYSRDVFQQAYAALPKPVYDVAKAKSLVAAAGKPSAPITIAVPADQRVYLQTAQTLQSTAKKIGLDIKIASLPTSQFNNLYYDPKARRPYDAMAVEEYGAGVAEPIVSLSEFTPLSAYDYGDLRDPGVTNGVRTAQQTYDDAARARAITGAQAALVKTNGAITVAGVLNSVYQGPKITGAPASLSFLYYPWAAQEGAR
jgi:peptide/nickel transport system substrate-binding protein